MLDDEEGRCCRQLRSALGAGQLRLIEEQLGLNLFSFRGTEPWIVPMQARYVIGRDGIIVFAEVAFDYSQRSEPVSVLPVLARLPGASAPTG